MVEKIFAVCLMCLFLPVQACTGESDDKPVFRKLPELAEIKPEKPVKIKFKRRAGGGYYWDVSGDNVEKIIKADRKLREYTDKLTGDR